VSFLAPGLQKFPKIASLLSVEREPVRLIMYRFLECTVGQYMTKSVKTVTRNVTLHELEALFAKHDFNAFPVVEGQEMVGLVTKFDFLKAFAFPTGQLLPHYNELMKRTVGAIMTEAVVHLEPAARLTRALQLMVNLKARSFPVSSSNTQLIGMLAREDIMRALKDSTRDG
jgi:CBS domain-containing protein